MVRFGQLAMGAAGAGKTTFCNGMAQFLTLAGRKVAVVNLDPANDDLPYDCAIDVRDLIAAESVEEEFKLGPNGSLVFCMEYLEKNLDWLEAALREIGEETYVVFDCPGQVELFALHSSFRNCVTRIASELDFRLVSIHLVDCQLCTDASNFLSAVLLSLNIMLNIELPHLNVLSKADLLKNFGDLELPFQSYLDVDGLAQLLGSSMEREHRHFSQKFKGLTQGLCEVIEDYSLVNFIPLAVEDSKCMHHLVKAADRSVGFATRAPAKPGEVPPEFAFAHSDAGEPPSWEEHLNPRAR